MPCKVTTPANPNGSSRCIDVEAWQTWSACEKTMLVAGVLGYGREPTLTMGFRDLDATKAVRELRVSVRCNMTARTSACRIASRKLGKQEPRKLSFLRS